MRFASQEAQESAELIQQEDEGAIDNGEEDRFELEIVPIGVSNSSNSSTSCLNGVCEEDESYPAEAIDAVMKRHGSFA